MSEATNGEGSGSALPPREPRPLAVHMAVASAVAFLLSAVLFWIIGLPFWMTVLFSVGVGIGAAPSMRRAEIESLARRKASSTDDP